MAAAPSFRLVFGDSKGTGRGVLSICVRTRNPHDSDGGGLYASRALRVSRFLAGYPGRHQPAGHGSSPGTLFRHMGVARHSGRETNDPRHHVTVDPRAPVPTDSRTVSRNRLEGPA